MLTAYRPLFAVPGAWRFIAGGFIARSAGAMMAVAIVAMIAGRRGSYELAGTIMAAGMVSMAVSAPIVGRLVDRFGQTRVMIPFFVWAGFWSVLTIVASLRGWPSWVFFLTFPCAAIIPNLGTMARARWSHIFAGRPRDLHSAMSFEQVMEEITFVIGPVVAIWLSTSVFPEAGLIFALGCYVLGVIVFLTAGSTEPPVVPPEERPVGFAFSAPGLIPLAFIMTMTGAIFGTNEVVTIAVADAVGHKAAAGPILAMFALGSAASGLVFGSISHGRNLMKMLLVGTLAMGVLEAPVLLTEDLRLIGLFMVVAGMATAPTLITTMNLIERLVPKAQLNEGMTMVLTGLIVGIALGSALSGSVIDRVGPFHGYVVAVCAGGLAFVIALGTQAFLRRRDLHNLR